MIVRFMIQAASFFLITLCMSAFGVGAADQVDLEYELSPQKIDQLNWSFTEDLDQMIEDRVIRVLIPYSRTFFFFDGVKPRGASYDAARAFEKHLNEKYQTGHLKVHLYVMPTARKNLIPYLLKGKGDIAMGNLTVTKGRRTEVDFSDPFISGVNEIVVSRAGAKPLQSIFDLSGRKVYARKSSSYHESLQKLNATLKSVGKTEVIIVEADDNLEDEDLLEMVNAGLIDYMVIDDHKGRFWAHIFNKIRLHPQIRLRTDGQIAWALRKNNPKLKALINEFVKTHKAGTLHGNLLLNRYLKDTSYITNSILNEHLKRFELTVPFFEKYGKQYDFDHIMLAALAYQESKLEQSLRSSAGAVGVMQILPSTAADKNIAIADIEDLEANIHAGTKYLRYMADHYFSGDRELNQLNRTLFCFASYNAGPGKVAQMRKEAANMGLDPDEWFGNVEVVAARQIGRETVQYVSNIFKYYVAYKLVEERMNLEEKAEKENS